MAWYHVSGCDCPIGNCDCGDECPPRMSDAERERTLERHRKSMEWVERKRGESEAAHRRRLMKYIYDHK